MRFKGTFDMTEPKLCYLPVTDDEIELLCSDNYQNEKRGRQRKRTSKRKQGIWVTL